MDEIYSLESDVIDQEAKIRSFNMQLRNIEDRITIEVMKEYNLNKKDPMLSNAVMRDITIRERMITDSEYSEILGDKILAETAVKHAEAHIRYLTREFIRDHCKDFKAKV